MNEITLLRAVRSDLSGPDAETTERARLLLSEAFASASPSRLRPKKTSRRWRILIPSFAATIVFGLVATGLTVGYGAPAQAASILNAAAALSPHAVDPVLRPGQYLEIQTTTESLFRIGRDGHDPSYTGAVAGWLERGTDTLYVPADRSDTWVWDRGVTGADRLKQPAVAYFGKGGPAARIKWFSGPRLGPFAQPVWKLAGGIEPGADGTTSSDQLGIDPRSDQMPRNSRLLLAWFRLQTGKLPVDSSHDFSIFGTIAEDLRWGLEPADLRAAMLRALALMPGVVVVGNMPTPSSPVATLSITGDGHTQQLTLDTDSGRVVGTETIDPQGNHGVDIFPKGIPTDVTTVKTVVVNGLPYLLEPKRDQ